jgi:hypothetical protein
MKVANGFDTGCLREANVVITRSSSQASGHGVNAWSPFYDPAIAILVYVRAAPDPRMKVYFYEPDATVSEKDDVMHGKINGPIEMTPDQFIEWCQEL